MKLPHVSVCTSHAGAEIKFGTMSDFVSFVPSPSQLPTEVHVPHLPTRGRHPNVIPPIEVREDIPATRTSVFDRLTFPKRVIDINHREDEEEPSFIVIAKGKAIGIFKKPKAIPTKSCTMEWPKLTEGRCPRLRRKNVLSLSKTQRTIHQIHLQTLLNHYEW